jgi:DNA-binding IclR family transcriptional regulator
MIAGLLQRVRGEYFEMPGLRLTSAQASRLWGLDTATCQRLLRMLVESRFLARTPDGRYYRGES